MEEIEETALGEVHKVANSDLSDKGIERTIAIGEKRDEFPIRRKRAINLAALGLREARKRSL